MNFHSTHKTTVSTPQPTNQALNASELASYLASYQKREKREIGTRVEKEAYEQLQTILKREKKTFQDWINEQIIIHIKAHAEGNPIYKLTNWTENPEFVAFPALMTDHVKWENWFKIQAERKNWDDLKDVKFKVQELQALLKRYYL